MKHIKTFETFVNESNLYGVDPNEANENGVIYDAMAKKAPAVGKKTKIKWKSASGFDKVACFTVTDIISNDLIVFKKFPGESFNEKDAKTNIYKKDFGIVSLPMHWSGGKLDPKGLPEDIVKLVNDMGLLP